MTAAVPLAGGSLSAYGDITQGKMTSDSLNNQAKNLQAQAAEAEQKGQYDAMRQQMISTQKIGTATAAYGASGVSANSGSVLDVIQASHQNAEMDRLNILHGADVKAINYQNQAAMDKFGADSSVYGSYMKALGALTMGGAMSAAAGAGKSPKTTGGESAANADLETEGSAGADTGAAMEGIA